MIYLYDLYDQIYALRPAGWNETRFGIQTKTLHVSFEMNLDSP